MDISGYTARTLFRFDIPEEQLREAEENYTQTLLGFNNRIPSLDAPVERRISISRGKYHCVEVYNHPIGISASWYSAQVGFAQPVPLTPELMDLELRTLHHVVQLPFGTRFGYSMEGIPLIQVASSGLGDWDSRGWGFDMVYPQRLEGFSVERLVAKQAPFVVATFWFTGQLERGQWDEILGIRERFPLAEIGGYPALSDGKGEWDVPKDDGNRRRNSQYPHIAIRAIFPEEFTTNTSAEIDAFYALVRDYLAEHRIVMNYPGTTTGNEELESLASGVAKTTPHTFTRWGGPNLDVKAFMPFGRYERRDPLVGNHTNLRGIENYMRLTSLPGKLT